MSRGEERADEWFADYIEKLEADPRRRRRLNRERVVLPVKDTLARAFADKTEQLTRFLRHEQDSEELGMIA